MRTGFIVTWFNSGRNYGQTLQAYALQKKLLSLGADASLITFGGNYSGKKTLYEFAKGIRYIKTEEWSKQHSFNMFISKQMKTTKPFKTYDEVKTYVNNNSPDFIICGSDQIWNPYNVNPFFYLNGLGTEKTKKMAYAVSLCEKRFSYKYHEYPYLKDWLEGLNYIYVRENSGKEILKEIYNIETEVVLDPTLLFSGEDWKNLLQIKEKRNKRYLFCYLFTVTESLLQMVEQKAKQLDLTIVWGHKRNTSTGCKKNSHWSPTEFLEMIFNAEYIVTDSFHVTAFSILFNKTFWVIDNGRINKDPYYNIDRMKTILNILGCEECLVNENNVMQDLSIDYIKAQENLSVFRDISTQYLRLISE